MKPPWKAAACAEGGYLEPFYVLEPPAHNTGCCVIGLTYSSGTFVSFFDFSCLRLVAKPQSRDRTGSQHDIQCSEPAAVARGQTCGAGVKSLRTAGAVPKSAVLPYASGVGGLSRRLLNRATPYVAAAGHSPSSAMGQTAVPPTPLHRTSVSPRALSGTLSFRRHVFAGNPHHRRGFPVPQAAPPKSIMSTVLPNTPFPKSKERMLGCWGGT